MLSASLRLAAEDVIRSEERNTADRDIMHPPPHKVKYLRKLLTKFLASEALKQRR